MLAALGRPDAVFRAALFLSALLHALLIAGLHLETRLPEVKAGGGMSLLTVTLGPPPAPAGMPSSLPVASTPASLPVPSPLPPAQSYPEPTPPFEAPAPPTAPQPTAPANAETKATTPTPALVDRRPTMLQEGMATAFLQISEEGRVLQIIWDQVPYVTPEELLEMERELRDRQYAPTGSRYTLAEAIQVPRARMPLSTADP
jgi:hypothetical protein